MFLTKEMHKYAGTDLVKKMNNVFGNEGGARNWFYSPLVSLGNKRPYDYCKKGNLFKIGELLGCMEYGVYL